MRVKQIGKSVVIECASVKLAKGVADGIRVVGTLYVLFAGEKIEDESGTG